MFVVFRAPPPGKRYGNYQSWDAKEMRIRKSLHDGKKRLMRLFSLRAPWLRMSPEQQYLNLLSHKKVHDFRFGRKTAEFLNLLEHKKFLASAPAAEPLSLVGRREPGEFSWCDKCIHRQAAGCWKCFHAMRASESMLPITLPITDTKEEEEAAVREVRLRRSHCVIDLTA